MLQAQQQASKEASQSQQWAAADMNALIPEYRATLARMKGQVDDLRQRLENACQEKQTLLEQVALLLAYIHLKVIMYSAKAAAMLACPVGLPELCPSCPAPATSDESM